MKRLVLMFAVLLFALGVQGSGGNVHYEASGTSDFTITFKSMAQGFAVLASSNPITVIAKVGTTAVDTMVVEAGNSMFFYCPANNLAIDRTLATAVTINPTFNNSIIPNLGATATTKITDLLDDPTPVTVSENVVFSGLDLQSTAQGTTSNLNKAAGGLAYRTFPVAGGVDVHGAKALYLVLDWVTFKKGYFTLQHLFGASSADTVFNYYDGATWSTADTIVVNDSTGVGALSGMVATAASLVFRIPDVPGEGYYFCKITAHDKVHLNSIKTMNATLVVVQ